MDTKVLEDIGFSKGEIKVYFALLELGDSTIGPISKKAGVTAAKTYPLLDKLAKKGLITNVIKSDAVHFQSFNPDRILNYIAEKQKKLKDEEKEIKTMLPQLVARQKSEAEQSATIYEGYNGLRTLYDEMVEYLKKSKEDALGFTLGDEYQDPNLMLFFEHYDTIRHNLGIKTKLIGLEGQKKYFKKDYMKSVSLYIRYVPYKAVPQGVIIFADKVATMVWGKNPAAFVIQNKVVAESYKKFFNDMWKIAKT